MMITMGSAYTISIASAGRVIRKADGEGVFPTARLNHGVKNMLLLLNIFCM